MKKFFSKKGMIVLCGVAFLALIGGIGSTVALMKDATGVLTNSFSAAQVETEIEEILDGEMGKEPYVRNISEDAKCLVRMSVVITPDDAKIELSDLAENGWYDGTDGFYYYDGYVNERERTSSPLFTGVVWKGADDYSDFEEFEIILYQEAVQVRAQDESGNTISAIDGDGSFNRANAERIWQVFDTGTAGAAYAEN